MVSQAELLVTYDFVNDTAKGKYQGKTPEEKTNFINKLKKEKGKDKIEKELIQDAQNDVLEVAKDQLMTLDYPKPLNRYQLVYESVQQSIEPLYYWSLNHLKYDLGYPEVEKITDIFTASEHSSFYGASAQRLGLAQDKVQQFLAAIGQFIRKDLFQLVRDIRWIDERVRFHEDARKGQESAEVTLKRIWTDLVDGVVQGQRVSANVFQMAQQLQFVSLPDLFFSSKTTKTQDIDKAVNAIGVTEVVKSVLKGKLHDYLVWREKNYEELKQRKIFELNYLRQHYNIIKMYMAWVKPYLKHIEKLRANVGKTGKADVISSFEGSMIDIEILGYKIPEKNKNYYSCILLTFEYRTKPSLSYSAEGGYHRGPIHVGETKVTWRAYSWSKEQIENYTQMKERGDLEDLGEIDNTIKATMEAIGEDLWKYLQQAKEAHEEQKKEEKKEKPKQPGLLDPFTAVGASFKEMFWPFGKEQKFRESMSQAFLGKPSTKKSKQAMKEESQKKEEEKNAEKDARKMMWMHYKNFKKAHGMLAW